MTNSLSKYNVGLLFLLITILSADVSHVIVFTDGTTQIGLIDSMTIDSLYYENYDTQADQTISLKNVYFIYNDFQRIFYTSPSFHYRLDLLEERGGHLVTNSLDSLHYARVRFDRQMIRPVAYLYTETDSLIPVEFLSIHHIRSALSIMEASVRKGFYSSLGVFATATLFEILTGWIDATKDMPFISMDSFLQLAVTTKNEGLDIAPKFTPVSINQTGTQYSSMNILIPLSTMGWMAYDLYFDKRTHYFVPDNRIERFPRSMYYFTLRRWINKYWTEAKQSVIPEK